VRVRHGLCLAAICLVLVGLASPAHAAPPEAAPPPSTEPIALNSGPGIDAAIEDRIETIFAELDSLAEVSVEVEAGVVQLGGQVFDLDARDEAEAIARRVEGVVTVASEIEQVRAVDRRVRPLVERLRAGGTEFLAFAPLLIVGVLIIALSWLIARLLGRLAQRRREVAGNVFVREVVGQIVRASIVILGIVLALELMGATTLIGAVLGTAGVVGLALGFAFRDMAENYIASLLLSVRQPFEPNDLVELEGHTGRVARLTSRATILLTLDGNHVRIPNATVFKGTIINYTRNPERRFVFELGVAVEADLARVQELAISTLAATPGILTEPGPNCLVEGFGDSAMLISVAGWVDQREVSWFKVGSEARRRIKVAFEQAGIDVPEPIFRVRTRDLDRELEQREASGEQIEAPAGVDVSPEHYIESQVDAERKDPGAGDLLSAEAPVE